MRRLLTLLLAVCLLGALAACGTQTPPEAPPQEEAARSGVPGGSRTGGPRAGGPGGPERGLCRL